MFDQAPNGYFLNDLIVFNGLGESGCVSKGFTFEPPDLTNAEVSELNAFQDQLSLLLASLTDDQRLQVQYYCDSDSALRIIAHQVNSTVESPENAFPTDELGLNRSHSRGGLAEKTGD